MKINNKGGFNAFKSVAAERERTQLRATPNSKPLPATVDNATTTLPRAATLQELTDALGDKELANVFHSMGYILSAAIHDAPKARQRMANGEYDQMMAARRRAISA